MLRAKGCSSRMRFLSVRKKVRDWVGLNAIADVVKSSFSVGVEMC